MYFSVTFKVTRQSWQAEMINSQTVKNANYDELSLHSHNSRNQSTERYKQMQFSCSFSRILDVPSTLWLCFVYDSTSLRNWEDSQRMPESQALRRNLPQVHARSGEECFRSCQNNSFANNDPNKLKPTCTTRPLSVATTSVTSCMWMPQLSLYWNQPQ